MNQIGSLRDTFLEGIVNGLRGSLDADFEQYIDPDKDPAAWIQKYFYIPETGRPIDLHESQIIPLREATRRDTVTGKFVYSTVVWGSIKKSAKSTIAAAMCVYMAWQKPFSSVKIVANDMKQAQSRVFYYAKRAILLHPHWRQICKISQTRIDFPNNSVIEAVPIDPEGEAGGNDDLVSYTEIWAWKSAAAQKMWSETTLSPTKYGESLRWLDTYAGFTGESLVLEPLYENAVKEKNCINPELEMYVVPTSRLFCLWNTQPHLPYQSKEYYAQESATLQETEFDRVHRNKWASSTEAFIPPPWWKACKVVMDPIDPGEPLILIADAGVSGDCFGLVGVTGNNEGDYFIVYAQKWTPPKDGRIDFLAVETEIRSLIDKYNIVEFAADEYQLNDMLESFEREMVVNVYRFSQQKERLLADTALRNLIRDHHVFHDGNPDLEEHVLNANAEIDDEEHHIRIVKRSLNKKIDLCVCVSMGVARAQNWNL